MKRSRALQPLSRDHHLALFVAHRLTRAEGGEAGEVRVQFLDFWNGHGRQHFVIEEEVLLPEFDPVDGRERSEVMRVLTEHTAIRRAAARLDELPEADLDRLHELGTLLHDHVRFEERVLFPLLEETLGDERLAMVGGRVLAAERRIDGNDKS